MGDKNFVKVSGKCEQSPTNISINRSADYSINSFIAYLLNRSLNSSANRITDRYPDCLIIFLFAKMFMYMD